MSNIKEFEQLTAKFQALAKSAPAFLEQLAVGEGVHAVAEAKKICKRENIVNTGNYRNSWQTDKKATKSGNVYYVRVSNNSNYATHLEYGFRSHFVPGHWEGNSFKYERGAKEGMYVGPHGGVVLGHYTLHRASKTTMRTQYARLTRKLDKFFMDVMGAK